MFVVLDTGRRLSGRNCKISNEWKESRKVTIVLTVNRRSVLGLRRCLAEEISDGFWSLGEVSYGHIRIQDMKKGMHV